MGLVIEAGDPVDAGDEFGILPTLLAMMIIAGVILVRTRNANRTIEEGAVTNMPIPQTGGGQEEKPND